MNLTFNFDQLNGTAQTWALQQVGTKHPVETREANLDVLVALYEYNKHGDIVNLSLEDEGQDPDYYEMDGLS